jgi:hypothetical protein
MESPEPTAEPVSSLISSEKMRVERPYPRMPKVLTMLYCPTVNPTSQLPAGIYLLEDFEIQTLGEGVGPEASQLFALVTENPSAGE